MRGAARRPRVRGRGSDSSVAFDLRTGRPIALEDLFGSTALPRADELLFAYEFAQARATKSTATGVDDIDCLDRFREGTELARGETRFHFAAEGLVVREDLPHVIAACADEVTVPYAALVSVAAPGSPLARLAAVGTKRPLRYRIRDSAGKETTYTPK